LGRYLSFEDTSRQRRYGVEAAQNRTFRNRPKSGWAALAVAASRQSAPISDVQP